MNDQEFIERLLANPREDSAEFRAALQGNAERERLRAQALSDDARLRDALHSVPVPAGLRDRLLDPRALQSSGAAANDSIWRRILPVAACLVVALGIAWFDRERRNAELEREIFAHVYWEEQFLANEEELPFVQVSAKMNEILGAEFNPAAEIRDIKVTYADDCWVARQISFHMIMKGKNGKVSVMMIPNSPVESEFGIGDERFQGLVTPTAAGNLVVIGERQEPIQEYRSLISRNLHWEY